jgi:glycosyltransferase involved in cell wall biosynthesis
MPHKPKKAKKWTVMVPAYNEGRRFNGVKYQSNLGEVLRPLKEWKKNHPNGENIRLLVVNDGSRDDTANIAKEEGIELIHSDSKDPHNSRGKADAVRAGALHARDVHNSDILVTLDADLKDLKGNNIDELMRPVLEEGYHMSVGKTGEGWQFSGPESGNRAIRLSALEPWLRGNPKWKPVKGYGLEKGLNNLIPKSKQRFTDGSSSARKRRLGAGKGRKGKCCLLNGG